MGSKKWAKSGSTPDWMDVLASMKAIDGIHLGLTMVTMLPAGAGFNGGLRIAISTSWEPKPGSPEMPCVISDRVYTNLDPSSLPAEVLGGLYAHDFAIGEAYQQRSFSTE